jgi:nitrous oxidase accessory protein NosD
MHRDGALRNNVLCDNATILLSGAVCDALVEKNRVTDTNTGVFVGKTCKHTLVTGNQFTRVTHQVK